MRKLICLLCLLNGLLVMKSKAQPALIDSFKTELKKAATIKEKLDIIGQLSRIYINVDPAESDKYGEEMIQVAEASRDRKLMIQALLTNGERYSYLAGRKENANKAIGFYEQALNLSRENKMDEEVTRSYLMLAEVHRYMSDADKALDYANQAFSYAGLIKNDSITAKVHLEMGTVYLLKSEKLMSLRNYLSALRISEEIKNNNLLRAAYGKLAGFYAGIEDYDRAVDFQVKAMDLLDIIKTGQSPYNKVQDLTSIGDLYASKKNNSMAMHYYEKSLELAENLKYEPIKVIAYRGIVNNYLEADEPQKALDYFNQHPQLKDFLQRLNFGYFVDQSYGYIYTRLGNYDSAKYFYNKIAPYFEKDVNINNQFSYHYQLGTLYRKTNETDKSLYHFSKAMEIASSMGNLDFMSRTAIRLDSLFQQKGQYQQAMKYATLNYQYKDSLNKLGKEKDLMQAEAADEQQRQERIIKEKEEIKRKRYSIQYLGITIGIAALFIILVMMGMFKVSVNTIKAIGFFAFLMFFEFIFLIFKKNIYSITHGEPWKDLFFMIGLAAILLPLHHWVEHTVIRYLTSHNRLTSAGHHIRSKLFGRSKEGDH